MNRTSFWLMASLIACILFAINEIPGFAQGNVYYGNSGTNFSTCGQGTPCRTYGYASNRACQLSDSAQNIYYIYHLNYGYSGFCDKSGGSGTVPTDREKGIPRPLDTVLWPMMSMLVAGFIVGLLQTRN